MKKVYLLLFASVLFVCSAKAQLVVFGDDYAPGISFAAFGGSTNTLTIDNSQSQSGTSSLKIAVTTGYTGGALVSAAPTNLSAYTALTFWAKNDQPAYKLDGVGLGNNASTTVYAVERNGVTLTSTWTKYYIPIPVASKLTAETGLFHFAEGSGEGAYNIWIDNIQYEFIPSIILGTPTAAFATETISKEVGATFNPNGTVSTYPPSIVPEGAMQTARAYFTWTSSNTSVATIDAFGAGTAVAVGSTNITGKLGSVTAAGQLTVNVSASVAPSTPAPTPPARNAGDVISLFSNAYTNNPVDTWSTGWSGCCHTLADLQITGNDTKKYELFHFAGVEFFGTPVDATTMEYIHLDIWSPNSTTFEVRLVDFSGATTEATVSSTHEKSKWVSLDIKLSDFTGLAARSKISQMLLLVPAGNSGIYYIDNIYFYKGGGSVGTEPTTAAPTPTKNAASVISLFSNAYTNVPVDTWSAPWDVAEVSDVQVAGNDTKKYTGLNFAGVEFTSNTIDATTMDYYHVDIWTPDATTFSVKLVDFGANGAFGGGDDTESQLDFVPAKSGWVSYDLKLSDFTGLASRAHLAQMLFLGSNSTLYVDNVYFYNSLLPVTLVEFKVAQKSSTAILQWSTASEQNNKGFAVERSSDATNWSQIAFVAGKINSNTLSYYSATDVAPVSGVNYYRLKQVDLDGRTTYYSPTKSLNFDASSATGLTVFPNPATTRVSVALGAIQSAASQYYIISADGKIVKSGSFDRSLSNTVQNIDVSRLQKGLYIIKLTDGTKQKSTKLIVD